MSVYLYSKGWDSPLADNWKCEEWEQRHRLLEDATACSEAIGNYQKSLGIPTFAKEKPDIQAVERKLFLAEGKEHIVVVGNGGSIRNVWALYTALIAKGSRRTLHLLDGTDPGGLLGELLRIDGRFSPENTLIVPVSKSGNTENVIQEVKLLSEREFPMIVVTVIGPSKLGEFAEKHQLERFQHPADVGGRFTAGQNNTLLPIALIQGDTGVIRAIDDSFAAIHKMLTLDVPPEKNMGKALALHLWKAELAGYTELFLPIYAKALAGLGELIVQLVHESYCKEGKGQSVIFAEAPESQHHTNQRYFGGRRNIAGLTIRVDKFERDPNVTDEISCGTFLDLEHAGVVAEADRTGIPHMVLTLDSLSTRDVVAAIALWQWAVVYGGLLRGVNPFDQPAVEGSKEDTVQMFKSFDFESRLRLDSYRLDAPSVL